MRAVTAHQYFRHSPRRGRPTRLDMIPLARTRSTPAHGGILPEGGTMVFDSYRDKYENVRMKREDGILEVALHTRRRAAGVQRLRARSRWFGRSATSATIARTTSSS